MTDAVSIRVGTVADVEGLARLKIEWVEPGQVSRDEKDAFTAALADWMETMGDRLVCGVAESGGHIVGMAWMVVFDRVPDFGNVHRVSADVQSVCVQPAFRAHGVGARLVTLVCAEADRRGIPRVLVHSSSGAVPLYKRLGFAALDRLLVRTHVAR